MIERLLRAGAAIVGGFQLAADHLRTHIDDDPTIPTVPGPLGCPLCHLSLMDGPHFHDQDAFWSTEDPRSILITNANGGEALVISQGDA